MTKWFLGGILLLAFFLRVPFLDLYPIGFTPDEASFGYDAYSILHTGKDQWGHTLPLVLESFGDFKAPLYTYIDIPFVAVLGLTKTAVRLPNALLGVVAVWVVYLLVNELTNGRQSKSKFKSKKDEEKLLLDSDLDLGCVAAFFLAISPWHVQLSRGAFEANMITFFVPMGLFFFLRGLKNKKYLPWSAFVFGLSLFTYHTAKVVTPLIVGFIVVLYWNQIKKLPTKLKRGTILIFASFILLTGLTFLNGAGRRAADISIANGALESQAMDRYAAIQGGLSPILSKVMYNKYVVISQRFWRNYSSYFSYDFLFNNGPREGTYGMIPQLPVLYWFELPLLLLFIFYAFKYHKEKHVWVIFFWLLISPVPASLTQGVGHAANRAGSMMPVLQICIALGGYFLYDFVRTKNFVMTKMISLVYCLIIIISFLNFAKTYILYSPSKLAKPMLYQNLEVAYWLRDNASDKTNIIVSSKLSEPHMYIAFANSWDPTQYQLETEDWVRYREENLTFLDQLSEYKIGKYNFKHIEKQDFVGSSTTLLVGRPDEFPDSMEIVKEFYYPNREPAIVVVSPYRQTYAYKN